MALPLVAIVGAPNLGKSTLFNRLVGWRKAIVTDEPGVTRDRNYATVRDAPRPFRVVDTGGLTPSTAAPFARDVEAQAAEALRESAVVLFLVDARAGSTALDQEIASFLRRTGVPVLLVANKADTPAQDHLVHDLHDLGFGEAVAVSAEHGRGIEELLEAIGAILDAADVPMDEGDDSEEEDRPLRIAIVGRPNVGKSSILNRLLGEDRVLVSEVPGTTRDSIDTLLVLGDRRFLLVDTAGIRKKGRVRLSAEASSVVLARRSMERADVVVLVLDGSEALAAQDAHIAGYAVQAYRPMVVAVNKWDIVEEREQAAKDWVDRIRHRLRFARDVPVLLVSARSGQRVSRILVQAEEVYRAAGTRVPTPELNRWLQDVSRAERWAPARGRSVRLYYATQTGVHPPSFLLFCNDPERVHFSTERFLRNSLRERFGLGPAPIRLRFRARRKARGE